MNVYYLPARQPNDNGTPEISLTASRWSVFQARAHRAWWRLRLTVSEVYAVVRRGGRNPLEDHIRFATDEASAPRRRTHGPARILDLEAARRRRTLAAATV
jgi:hypothetical protein